MSGKKNLAQAGVRRARVIKVAPVTHAVRLALAATTLALAGTGAAYAGTCSTSGSTVQCTGTFTDTLSYPDVVDLTLVVGDGYTPTSVTPAAGYDGVDVSGSGAIAVTNYGNISTYGADGINAYSSGSLSVTNDGTVYTEVTGPGQEAIDASANGDVDVTNNNRVVAYGYGGYDVTAVRAQTDGCGCTVTVENTGDASIVAYSTYGNAVGIYAYAADGTAHVGNDGSIGAYSRYGLADGVFAAGSDVGVRNGGSIVASGYNWAAAIEAEGSDVVTVHNDGALYAYANGYTGHAFGIYAVGGTDGATIANTGLIRAVGAYATGIDASALGNVTVTNSGDIEAGNPYRTAYATGIRAASNGEGGVVSVTNDGFVGAYSYFSSTGIEVVATGTGASASVSNTGTVYASTSNTSPYSKYGSAVGIVVSADGDAHIDNSGTIYVSQAANGGGLLASQGFQPYAGGTAYGAMALSFNGDASVSNSGDIHVVTEPFGYGVGILAASQNGNASVDNSGLVQTSAKYSYGILATSSGGDVSVSNADSGVVFAYSPTDFASALAGIATVGDVSIDNAGAAYAVSIGTGVGVLGISSQGSVSESNSGYVVAAAYYGEAIGMFGRADLGTASVDNSGAVHAYAYHGTAVGLLTRGDIAQANNSGDIGAYAYQNAYGIEAIGTSSASIHNDGSIVASANNGVSIGALAVSPAGDVTIDGTGSVAAYGPQLAVGLYGYAPAGTVTIGNDGSVYARSEYGVADGIFAAGQNIGITSTGSIAAQGYHFAAGIEAHGDVVSVDNSGSVQANAGNGYAYGVFATGATSVSLTNSGSVDASGRDAFGLYADGGDITVDNSGDVTVNAGNYGSAIRVHAGGSYGVASVTNIGTVYATSGSVATGIVVEANGYGATGSITNSGAVYASSTGKYGVAAGLVVSAYGDASIDNSGMVATSGGRTGYGALAISYAGNASISNTGDIQVSTGFFGRGMGLSAESQYGDASIDNSGSVIVNSKYAIGAMATSRLGDATVHNGATGVVGAYSNGPFAVGLAGESYSGNVQVGNDGAVYAYAGSQSIGLLGVSEYGDVHLGNTGTVWSASYGGVAFGAMARSAYGDAAVDNAGTISAESIGGAALGVVAMGDTVHVGNTGTLQATTYSGSAYGLYASGRTAVHVTNGGTVAANALSTGDAFGLAAYSGGTLDIANSGTISATAADSYGQAIGLSAVGYGAVHVDNSGLITASHPDYAVAVSLDSATVAVLHNTGTIRTDAPVEGQVAVRGGDGVEQVLNYGHITGAMMLHGGDDLFLNGAGGTWTVGNHATDFGDGNDTLAITGGLVNLTNASIAFGAGDDAVVNAAGGTLRLDNGAIYLGDSSSAGNSFTNAGRIQVVGTGNLIDMGTGPAAALAASTNPLALANNGVIDFVDGAPDDVLTINGDLGGNGLLRIDLRPLTHASDLLYVDGNVASGAVQTVDVDFGGMPTTAMLGQTTTFAHVSGTSAAGSFVGGRVIGWDVGDFINLQVGVTSQIDASGATADLFSVGVQAVGLTDPGALAASMGAGAQSLVDAQVGTWRQRMGVQPENGSIGLSPWLRMFSDAGDVKPGHVASNFGDGGNFDFQQSNSGWEVGLNTRPGEHLNLGVLAAKSEGRQHLKDGSGTDHLDGRTFGIYGTWVGDRFYVDASMRWMGFDARMLSAGVQQSGHGEADAFNIEAGYTAWTLGNGIALQPQVQYTRTRVGSDPIRATLATFQADTANSSRARVGLGVSKAMARGGWTWTPYGSLNVVHEFEGEYGYRVDNDFFGSTSTKGTSALVELGVGARKDKLSVTGGVNWTDGGALSSVFGGQLVVRYNW